jgi:hypothetical protein
MTPNASRRVARPETVALTFAAIEDIFCFDLGQGRDDARTFWDAARKFRQDGAR